ncbi:DUF2461 domain-containing protein [Capnocytophaga canimorsus]|uniref:DUF2461 domain-containing protein n=1 Tax=Capnocytophaga canimorsus TaxID=28188 RepID=UPI001AC22154|nr:DUF2461 domain-containing protein [Capnocytophaga canimorsus]GIM59912.1 TIGR02453 family protein [Capnocytophaga canimorsus]
MKTTLQFLKQLAKNNNRDWFLQHKAQYESVAKSNKRFFEALYQQMQHHDNLERIHIFRIYKDVRFSKEKTPYKNNFGVAFFRTKPLLRGGYYLHLEPEKSFVGGGFWAPEPADLHRIRKEFEIDETSIKAITEDSTFKKYFGELQGEDGVKTAPKGFDKNHPAIALIKKKQYVIKRSFTDDEVCSMDFQQEVIATFLAMRPFFDYMSEVLTTDLNGTPIVY